MEGMEYWLERRANDDVMSDLYKAQLSRDKNATQRFIQNLVLGQSKSVRTSTIILASFNIIAAFATATSILYDCYCAHKRSGRSLKSKCFFLNSIHPAETFPLILTIAITIQGIIFAVSQSTGLNSLLIDSCDVVAQLMFPAIFLPFYIQMVFGLEYTIRSLRRIPFQARGKWDVTICLGVVLLMTIGTWIPTNLNPAEERCFASLVWFVVFFWFPGLIIISIIGACALASAVIIFWRLSSTTMIDQDQRIAASRMVYYLVLCIVSLAFVIPWFITLAMGEPNMVASMMATVVLNLTGLMSGLLQLFLRSNTATTSFRPKNTPGWSRKKHEIRMWGPNELGFGGHLLRPVSGPRSPGSINSRASLVDEKPWVNDSRSPEMKIPMNPLGANVPTPSGSGKFPMESPAFSHRRRPSASYSLFPAEEAVPSPSSARNSSPLRNKQPTSMISTTQLPATTFQPSRPRNASPELAPPPQIFMPRGHRRDSSMISSATVQIGLRLSHMDEDQPPLPDTNTIHHQSALSASSARANSPFLRVQTQNLMPTRVTSPLGVQSQDARMKTLPPVPGGSSANDDSPVCQLSPTVYHPESSSKKATTGSPSRASPGREPRARTSRTDWI